MKFQLASINLIPLINCVGVSLCFSSFALSAFPGQFQPKVSINRGQIKGSSKSFGNKTINEFLGIRYGQPMTGPLRFQRSLSCTTPYGRKPHDATHWPSPCPQTPSSDYYDFNKTNSAFSEDCLFLNVWSPPKHKEQPLKPVLVFIHGGFYRSGGISQLLFNGAPLAATGDMVVVLPAYRLGVFGFIAGGTPNVPGNQAVGDLILSLKWVKENIEGFGGDPDRVTISGESAGGALTELLFLSPVSRNLFQSALSFSFGLSVESVDSEVNAVRKGGKFAQLVGCQKDDSHPLSSNAVDCLQKLDVSKLVEGQSVQNSANSIDPFAFVPMFGDHFLPKSHREMVKSNDFKQQASLMVGNMNYEGSLIDSIIEFNPLFKPFLNHSTRAQWQALMLGLLSETLSPQLTPNMSAKIVEYYFANEDTPANNKGNFIEALADYQLVCPQRLFAERVAINSGSSAYYFYMTYKSNSPGSFEEMGSGCDPRDGVCHGSELQYVFGKPFLFLSKYNDMDREMSHQMMTIISQFVNNSQVFWPKYYRSGSGLVVATSYELNPLKRNKLDFDYKLSACKALWESFIF